VPKMPSLILNHGALKIIKTEAAHWPRHIRTCKKMELKSQWAVPLNIHVFAILANPNNCYKVNQMHVTGNIKELNIRDKERRCTVTNPLNSVVVGRGACRDCSVS
jgi:hypothetical protein